MGDQNSTSLISPVSLGVSNKERWSPPWLQTDVQWLGKGFFVLKLSDTERWFLVGQFEFEDVYPHERTFRKFAVEKSQVMKKLKMNPWPTHLAAVHKVGDPEPVSNLWINQLKSLVKEIKPFEILNSSKLWKVEKIPSDFFESVGLSRKLMVLDGHHSRRAQQSIGLNKLFGFLEPLHSDELKVRPIHRAGWLTKAFDEGFKEKELEALIQSKADMKTFEIVEAAKQLKARFRFSSDETDVALDQLVKFSRKRKIYLKSSPEFNDILSWIKNLEADTGIRLPEMSKHYLYQRAVGRKLLPQKATSFYPKLPFGMLIQKL